MVLAAVKLRNRPLVVGALILCASAVMRLGFVGFGYGDQITVSQSAWERVLAGGNPYGVGYASTTPPGAPFPYGPLGLVWWLPGSVIEYVAAVATMAVLLRQRAWLTLAVIAGWYPSVYLTFTGINDYSPGLLILLALLALRARPVLGAILLAGAAALKPYAFAWYLPAIGFAGPAAAMVLLGSTAVLWSPLFFFWGGLGPFLETIRLAERAHPTPNALAMPMLRWLAAPFAALGLFSRRWDVMVILGSAAFIIFLFLADWASYGYWLAVLPALGVALEERFVAPRAAGLDG